MLTLVLQVSSLIYFLCSYFFFEVSYIENFGLIWTHKYIWIPRGYLKPARLKSAELKIKADKKCKLKTSAVH